MAGEAHATGAAGGPAVTVAAPATTTLADSAASCAAPAAPAIVALHHGYSALVVITLQDVGDVMLNIMPEQDAVAAAVAMAVAAQPSPAGAAPLMPALEDQCRAWSDDTENNQSSVYVEDPVPPTVEQTVGVAKVRVQECEQQRPDVQVLEVPRIISQECVQQLTSVKVVDVTRADSDEMDEGIVEVANVEALERVRQLCTEQVDDCDARSSTSDVGEHRRSGDHSARCVEKLGTVFGAHWLPFSEKTRKQTPRAIRSVDIHALLVYLCHFKSPNSNATRHIHEVRHAVSNVLNSIPQYVD